MCDGGAGSLGPVTNGAERTRWKIRSDRLVDETPQVRLSIASLELASGLTFEQYVMRLPRCAMTVVLDDAAERILLIWRHRFIIDQWLWELPGGYIDLGEEGIVAAAREVEEETGYRPRSIEPILTFQPMTGSADSAHELYLARGADRVGNRRKARSPPRGRGHAGKAAQSIQRDTHSYLLQWSSQPRRAGSSPLPDRFCVRENNERFLEGSFADTDRLVVLMRVPLVGNRTITPSLSNPDTVLFGWPKNPAQG